MNKQMGVSPQQQQPRTLTRILLNFLLFAVLTLLVSTATTQYLAYQLGYHASLTGHLGNHLYLPWSWADWAWRWWSHYRLLMQTTTFLFVGGMAACFFIYAFGLFYLRRRSKAVEGLHGTAHWADRADIQNAGLLPKGNKAASGVYVGAWQDEKNRRIHYLRHDGPEHVLAFAPTRSGKGVGLVLPTLLSWPHSCLVYDIKGENWALTAGWRKYYAHNHTMKFDPTSSDKSNVRFNPLAEIDLDSDTEVGDTQNIATMIIDPDGKGLNDHWTKTGFALLTAVILHICYVKSKTGEIATIADIGTTLANPDKPIMEVLEEMRTYPHKQDGTTHSLVQQEARSMLNKPEKEMGSVVSTVESTLSLYRDPIVQKNTAASDFRIKDLMNADKPVSLYLVVRPSDADRVRPLIRLMISQITKKLTQSMEFKDGKSVAGYEHRLLLMLDEFASLKTLTAVEDALSFAAGYGLKFYLIVQDLQQIVKAYGREEGLIGNCHIRIAYAPNKIETAELLSKMSGTTTIVKEQFSESGKKHGLVLGQVSRSWQEVQRPLLTADEAMRLPQAQKDQNEKIIEPGHMLIFVAGNAPVYGVQILYFTDPVFLARAQVAAPTQSDKTRLPTSLAENFVVNDSPAPETAPTEEQGL